MLTEEYAALLGGNGCGPTTTDAAWAIEDARFWEADYADPARHSRLREQISVGRPDAGLRTFARERQIFRHIRPAIQGKTLLDIGCGSAQTIQVLCHPAEVGYDYVGVDVSLSALVTNQREFPGTFIQASGSTLPFPPESFDAIVMLGTLHHLPDPVRALDRILDLLRPDGLIGLHEVTYRRRHHADIESAHNDAIPLEDTLRVLERRCRIVDVRREGTFIAGAGGERLAERMRTSPVLTRTVRALDAAAAPLGRIHKALGPRGVLVTARRKRL